MLMLILSIYSSRHVSTPLYGTSSAMDCSNDCYMFFLHVENSRVNDKTPMNSGELGLSASHSFKDAYNIHNMHTSKVVHTHEPRG